MQWFYYEVSLMSQIKLRRENVRGSELNTHAGTHHTHVHTQAKYGIPLISLTDKNRILRKFLEGNPFLSVVIKSCGGLFSLLIGENYDVAMSRLLNESS